MSWGRLATVVVLALSTGCAGVTGEDASVTSSRPSTAAPATAAPTTTEATTTTQPPTTTTAPSTTTTTAAPATTAPRTTTAARPQPVDRRVTDGDGRIVHEQPWSPFAAVGGVVLRHPSARVERVGFHQSNHDGARDLEPLATAADPIDLETRDRDTGMRTSADVVVDPEVEIRSPVSGRVRRAGTYVLYCDYSDDYAVIEPDAHPGWEVKILHIDGVRVRAGSRVEAGRTVLAPRPTRLPFESQIDEFTADPAWPHVHIEVVDPSIRDRPSGRGC